RPRPVFQSYTAYTSFLIHANAEFYRSDHAPVYVIASFRTVDTLDSHFPTQDDSEAYRVLLLNYELVLQENMWLLWRKLAFRKTAMEEITGADEMEIGFGQEVPLSGSNLWSVIDIKETALGKLRNFFYKPPILFIHFTDKDHPSTTYRILPSIARSGFILDYHISS